MSTLPRTIVYVDGFNLYYGALKNTPHKWLNLEAFFPRLFPKNDIQAIRYFTARVKPNPGNPDGHLSQQLYLRALATLPSVQIVEGYYLQKTSRLPLANPPATGNRFAEVIISEEKGSDVNIAAHLLLDAFRDRFDVAIIVSGDSDLATPITMVRQEFSKPVGVLQPYFPMPGRSPRRASKLQQVASFFRSEVRAGPLRDSQFPDAMHDTSGPFFKPRTW